MRRTTGLALAFFVTAFAAGAAVGVTTDRYLERERNEQQWNDPKAMRKRLADNLGMSDVQRVSLDSLLDDRNRQYDSLMALVRPQLDSLSSATRLRLRQMLTPEQQATYDQIQREREEARRQEKKQ